MSSESKTITSRRIERLKGADNYDYRSRVFRRNLTVEGLAKYLDVPDEANKDAKPDTDPQKVERDTNRCLFELSIAVEPEHLHFIDNASSPAEAWSNLRRAFLPQGVSGIFRVFREMEELRCDPAVDGKPNTTNVEQFLAKRSSIVAKAAQIGLNFEKPTTQQVQQIELMRILNKRPQEDYRSFIDDASRKLALYTSTTALEEELRQFTQTAESIRAGPSTIKALAANRQPRPDITCSGCNIKGHSIDTCWFK